MKRHPAFAAILFLSAAATCIAQERAILKTYRLNPGIVAEVAETVRSLVGTNGTVAVDETGGKLMVLTSPAGHSQIAELLDGVDLKARNIDIAVTTFETSLAAEPPPGTEKPDSVLVTPTDSGARVRLAPHMMERAAGRDSVLKQTITVSEGSEASLKVSSEVPCAEWLVTAARRAGLLGKETDIKQVATSMSMQPRVMPDGITIAVRIVPELTGLAGASRVRIRFQSQASELTVKDGNTVSLASLASDEFYEKFLTGSISRGKSRHVVIELTPGIRGPK